MFEITTGLNKKGKTLLEAYETYKNDSLPEFIKNATEKALLQERCVKLREAVKNNVTVKEFEEILSSYKAYNKGNADFADECTKYIDENMVNVSFGGKNNGKVIIRKLIGIKLSQVSDMFGVDKVMASNMFHSGFITTFVNTYVKKLANSVINRNNDILDNVSVKVSDAHKANDRNYIDINVDFYVSPLTFNDCIMHNVQFVCDEIDKIVILP